ASAEVIETTSEAPRRNPSRRSPRSSSGCRSPSTSISPATYARPRPSSPGAVSRRWNARGVLIRTIVGASPRPSVLPSQNSNRTGRSPTNLETTGARASAGRTTPRLLSGRGLFEGQLLGFRHQHLDDLRLGD